MVKAIGFDYRTSRLMRYQVLAETPRLSTARSALRPRTRNAFWATNSMVCSTMIPRCPFRKEQQPQLSIVLRSILVRQLIFSMSLAWTKNPTSPCSGNSLISHVHCPYAPNGCSSYGSWASTIRPSFQYPRGAVKAIGFTPIRANGRGLSASF